MKTSVRTAPVADVFEDDRLSRRRSILIRVHGRRERHDTMVPWYNQHLLWTCQRACRTAAVLPITATSARECQGASKRPLIGVCRGAVPIRFAFVLLRRTLEAGKILQPLLLEVQLINYPSPNLSLPGSAAIERLP